MALPRPLLVTVATLGLGVAAAAQEPAVTFRTALRTVPIYATVTDARGRLVPGLERADFEVRDSGNPVDLTIFENAVQPITIVLMLDTSGSMTMQHDVLRHAAGQFVNGLLPGDRARIGSFSNRVRLGPADFTGDLDELRRILREDLEYGNSTAVWDAIHAGMDALATREGRRVILLFTDGVDSQSRHNQGDVLSLARSQQSLIYAIALRSRVAGRTGFPPDPALRKVVEETGGGYIELNDWENLNGAFARVASELHSQYLLGFSPRELDGKIHPLQVTIKRPGLVARARKSYIAK